VGQLGPRGIQNLELTKEKGKRDRWDRTGISGSAHKDTSMPRAGGCSKDIYRKQLAEYAKRVRGNLLGSMAQYWQGGFRRSKSNRWTKENKLETAKTWNGVNSHGTQKEREGSMYKDIVLFGENPGCISATGAPKFRNARWLQKRRSGEEGKDHLTQKKKKNRHLSRGRQSLKLGPNYLRDWTMVSGK